MHCLVWRHPQLTKGTLPQGLPIHLLAALTYHEFERFFQDEQPADSSGVALCCCTHYHILFPLYGANCEKYTVRPLLWGTKVQQSKLLLPFGTIKIHHIR